MGWRVGLGPVGGLQLARPRVMSRKTVARGRLGLDTGYGKGVSLVGSADEHL